MPYDMYKRRESVGFCAYISASALSVRHHKSTTKKDIYCKSWLFIALKAVNGLPNELMELDGLACFKKIKPKGDAFPNTH